jgi:putative hydrolase of the HAD superfamily
VSRFDALLIDFGGVLTTNVFDAFGDFCSSAGLPRDAVAAAFRTEPAAALLREVETGRLAEADFEVRFAPMLCAGSGVDLEPEGLIARLTTTLRPDQPMLDVVERINAAGHATVIVSNSFGYGAYDGYALERRFDHVILSGDVGLRKPSRRIYQLAAKTASVAPERCVFVDDLAQNIVGAERTAMTGVHHTDSAETIRLLEELFEMELAAG